MSRFAGRTIVITGASRGLGRAMAIQFAAEGGYVYVGFRKMADEAAETVRLLPAAGGGEALQFDVTDRAQVASALERVHDAHEAVDVLVCNAGIARDAPFLLLGPDQLRDVLAVNLEGAFHCSQAVLPRMMRRRRGSIVNIASLAGLRASPGQANYAASKAGLLALTRTLATEFAPRGIRVNAVVPGLIEAGMVQRLDRNFLREKLALVPLARLGRAQEVAAAALFLASDDASYMTGCELVVDGGLGL